MAAKKKTKKKVRETVTTRLRELQHSANSIQGTVEALAYKLGILK